MIRNDGKDRPTRSSDGFANLGSAFANEQSDEKHRARKGEEIKS